MHLVCSFGTMQERHLLFFRATDGIESPAGYPFMSEAGYYYLVGGDVLTVDASVDEAPDFGVKQMLHSVGVSISRTHR